MSPLDFPSPPAIRLRIDPGFILRQEPRLIRVRRRQCSWDAFGEQVLRDFFQPRISTIRTVTGELAEWELAKELVNAVLTSSAPEYDGIRKRIGNPETASTPMLFSTLSLWLAGILKISVSLTMPMTAAILYGIGEAGGDPEVLR
jgi:hypothetical protein